MIVKRLCEESKNPKNAIEWIKYKLKWGKEHPDYFLADGLTIFVGPQGSGKTLSAVNYVYGLMEQYPRAQLVTNLSLRDYPVDEYRVYPFRDNDDFAKYGNGEFGVIYLVDEIQLYLNSLESKNINLDVVAQISQQRKQRKHIVATSQVFGRMAKPLREQFDSVILCRCIAGFVQYNQLLDRNSLESDDSTGTNLSGAVADKFIWLHNPTMYERYDTYTVIQRGKFVSAENQRKEIYKNGLDGLSRNV